MNTIETTINQNNKLTGIKGWLVFFIFTLCVGIIFFIIACLTDIAGILKTHGFVDGLYLVFLDALYFGGLVGFTIYTIYSFVNLKPNAIALGKMYVVLRFTIFLVSTFYLLVVFKQAGKWGHTLGDFIYCSIWFPYLFLSKRVNNTFPKETREVRLFDKIFFLILIFMPLIMFSIVAITKSR